MANLRTKTGCLTCRTRRKKCDETRDSCHNCLRNSLECTWPTKEQEKDRRNLPRNRLSLKTSNNGSSVQALNASNQSESLVENILLRDAITTRAPRSQEASIRFSVPTQLCITPASTEESRSTALFASFVHDFLPRRIRPHSHPHFFQFSYTYDLAPRYPALLNACLACATSAIGAKFEIAGPQMTADRFYARSIRALRTTIHDGGCEGNEDWLLATVVILCLYENQKPGYDPVSASSHIAAAGQIFRERARRRHNTISRASEYPHSSTLAWPALIFERIFAESFLYHSMMMSVRDKNLTPLQDPTLRNTFDTYFERCQVSVSPEPENWPIFGMHYLIVRLFSDLVASLDVSQTAVDIDKPLNLEGIVCELETWKRAAIINNYGLHALLYISAAMLLGYCHLCASSPASERYSVAVRQELDYCMNTLSQVEFTEAVPRYFHWPLAIIEKVVRDPRASNIVRQKLNVAAHFDPEGKKAYDWVAEGFEQRFKPGWR